MRPERFLRRPYAVEAVQLTTANRVDVKAWVGPQALLPNDGALPLILMRSDGVLQCHDGWWVVKGPDGDVAAYDAAEFEGMYEPLGMAMKSPS